MRVSLRKVGFDAEVDTSSRSYECSVIIEIENSPARVKTLINSFRPHTLRDGRNRKRFLRLIEFGETLFGEGGEG